MGHPFKAVAAMSLNRVIGQAARLPWHIPADFKWFKSLTTGHVIVMGRKTFESIGRALPNRTTVVLSRSRFSHPGVETLPSLDALRPDSWPGRHIFICGGGEIYRQALPLCSDLFLTLVKRNVDGDAFFPPFEEDFGLRETLQDNPEFAIYRYSR